MLGWGWDKKDALNAENYILPPTILEGTSRIDALLRSWGKEPLPYVMLYATMTITTNDFINTCLMFFLHKNALPWKPRWVWNVVPSSLIRQWWQPQTAVSNWRWQPQTVAAVARWDEGETKRDQCWKKDGNGNDVLNGSYSYMYTIYVFQFSWHSHPTNRFMHPPCQQSIGAGTDQPWGPQIVVPKAETSSGHSILNII